MPRPSVRPKQGPIGIGALAIALAMAPACGSQTLPPLGQIVLYVDTDAPVTSSTDVPSINAPIPLFDRLRVDVYGACSGGETCVVRTREFEVRSEQLAAVSVSFDIVGAPASSPLVRLRLHHGAVDSFGVPLAGSTLDAFVKLGPVLQDQVREQHFFLATDGVGKTRGSIAAPIAADDGRPPSSLVGTWPPAQRRSCKAAPRAGEVCVPSGAYWFGRLSIQTDESVGRLGGERLVTIDPFFVDATEMLAQVVREQHDALTLNPQPWTGSHAGNSWDDWCTYAATAGETDALPANCIVAGDADAVCNWRGGRLPTEAELEYLEGGIIGATYVWGEDAAIGCNDVVFGRSTREGLGTTARTSTHAVCTGGKISVLAPLRPASAARDVLSLPDGKIFDLAGNVGEIAADGWSPDESCWSDPGVHRNPLCPATTGYRISRGGYFAVGELGLVAVKRVPQADASVDNVTGFRCARVDSP